MTATAEKSQGGPKVTPATSEQPGRGGEVRELDLAVVRFVPATQMRVGGLDEQTVDEYKEAMLEGAEFPPGRAFYDGTTYWGSRGWHRTAAAKLAGRGSFPFEVYRGGLREAVLDAVGANSRHGLRRTYADKRRAVETLLKDREWVRWSDTEIARRAGVGKSFIHKMRRKHQPEAVGTPRLARRGSQVYEMHPAGQGASAEEKAPDYYRYWLYYLVRFSPVQFVRWQRIVNLRTDRGVVAEATEIVMREVATQ